MHYPKKHPNNSMYQMSSSRARSSYDHNHQLGAHKLPTKMPWPEAVQESQKEASQALDEILKALQVEVGISDK